MSLKSSEKVYITYLHISYLIDNFKAMAPFMLHYSYMLHMFLLILFLLIFLSPFSFCFLQSFTLIFTYAFTYYDTPPPIQQNGRNKHKPAKASILARGLE